MQNQKNTSLVPIVVKIGYQFTENVTSIVKHATQNKEVVTFTPGNTWKQFYFSPSTASFAEPPKLKDAGQLFNQTVTCKVPGEYAGSNDELTKLLRLPVIVAIVYSSGLSKIIGSKKVPAYFKTKPSSDKQGTGNTISFVCETTHFAKELYVEGTALQVDESVLLDDTPEV